MTDAHKVHTCLWFEKDGEAAAEFYVSLLPDSGIDGVFRPDGKDAAMVSFRLAGTPYAILNGGKDFKLTEAASISVYTEAQAETDRLWDALIADGGAPNACGWLKDRWGVSWQIVPRRLPALLSGEDPGGRKRAFDAMLSMGKIDIAGLEAAYRGEAAS
ncbi:VOC family protein [Parvularcula dongshanensis]|uniref:Putative 3-demethylubiquinone-9 3-methyltransferase (Glyoxalase superfamily) n=1 Tax=Parvularcula dongshanensis TaxID=1173995 RepID=A0A840I8P9_9PROT|nr:putative 3-demethylubiquinone-9 3-methyltransferase (glyoxalase superfamily) [Parvularcula dongshanensis]